MFRRLTNLLTWKPLDEGAPAPKLSLTADEGTWIRLEDFKGHINVVLLFFRSLNDDATDAWLKGYQRRRQQFEELETAIFGVSTYRTDRLREFRSSLGLEYYLLYDPLSVDSRAFRSSSRWRPILKNNVVVVGKDGAVKLARRGMVEADEVLRLVAGLEGAEVPVDAPARSDEFTGIRDPGKAAARVKMVGPDQAAAMLGEKDSPYVLLDVRTQNEYDADHDPSAILIPLDELPHRYRELDQTTHVICIGQVTDRSVAAAEFLTSIGGSEIYVVEGGMTGWTGVRSSKARKPGRKKKA